MIYCCITKIKPIDTKELDRILAFASVYLGIEDDVCVNVIFSKTCNADGYAAWNEDEDVYDIEINSRLSKDDIIRTIFHEVVHVKQIHEKLLEPDDRIWNGVDCSELNYDEYPWEIDAYVVENELMEKYLQTRDT